MRRATYDINRLSRGIKVSIDKPQFLFEVDNPRDSFINSSLRYLIRLDLAANKAILDYMMSRNSLTSSLGQLAAGSRSTDFDKMSQLRNTLDLAANTLGAVVYVDDAPILFNEFLNAGKGQGKSIGEILREWEQLH